MKMFKMMWANFKALLNSPEYTRTKWNLIASNQKFIDEQVDGVDSKKNKEMIVNEIKTLICNIIRNNSKSGYNILDFGCGTGRYLKELENNHEYNLFGLDIAENVIENYTRNNVKSATLVSTNILKNDTFINKYDSYFDLIYSITTLEYIAPYDLNKLFGKFKILLVEDGVLILKFPIPANFIESITPRYFRHQPIVIENKLKKNGFVILESKGLGTDIRIKRFNKDNPKIREYEYVVISRKI